MSSTLPPDPEPGTPAPNDAAADALVEEARVGGSEGGRAINLALLALSRTARSFQLYDASNEAVSGFLDDLQAKVQRALQIAGSIVLEVRPFELACNNEVVYLERDRERSLAFRFFRDGVRRITLAREMPWSEVLSLLEVLSVRYAGVRQNEDDFVTLLGKAGFLYLKIESVEGFVPDEEVAEEGASGAPAEVELGIDAPPDWDLPAPVLPPPAPIAYRELTMEERAALAAEEAPDTVVANAVAMVVDLLQVMVDPDETLAIEELLPTVMEVRDVALAEGALRPLITLVEALGRASAGDLRPVASPVIAFATPDAVRRLLRGLHAADDVLPPELFDYLRILPGDHVAQLMDMLVEERDDLVRTRIVAVLTRLAEQRPDQILRRIPQADPLTARALLGAFAAGVPDRALEAALLLKDSADPAVQLEVLVVLARLPYSTQVGRTVLRMLSSPDERVHLMAVEILATRGEQRAFDAMATHVVERAGSSAGLSPREAEALGEALARLDPAAARALFADWLKPKGLLRKMVETPAQRLVSWTAISGLGALPGDEPEAALRELLERTSEEVHRHVVATLVQRRRRAQQATRPRTPQAGS